MTVVMRRPDIGYLPTELGTVQALLALAEIQPTDVIYDLGSGDGRVVIQAAQQYGVRGVGIDIDPVRIQQAQNQAQQAGVSPLVEFRPADLYTANFQDATVVVLYLLPHLNLRLRPRLLEQLAPGTRILSHQFDMGDWRPDRVVTVQGEEEESILYRWQL